MRLRIFLFLSLISISLIGIALAEDQERSQRLAREIRCVACENEPVSQSAAPIAEDMRDRIDQMISEGATDQEIRDWFATRYGEYALFRPSRTSPMGVILWGTPFILLACGALIVAYLKFSRKNHA